MNHIKRWGSIRESVQDGEECDFETFKEILLEISDEFTCNFQDNSDESYYSCTIKLPMYGTVHTDDSELLRFNFDYLTDLVGYADDPNDFQSLSDPTRYIRQNKENLEKLSSNLKDIVSAHNRVLKLFYDLEHEILPRFREYSNFVYMSVGMGADGLVIGFEIDDEE